MASGLPSSPDPLPAAQARPPPRPRARARAVAAQDGIQPQPAGSAPHNLCLRPYWQMEKPTRPPIGYEDCSSKAPPRPALAFPVPSQLGPWPKSPDRATLAARLPGAVAAAGRLALLG